jgi:hypothetical protein
MRLQDHDRLRDVFEDRIALDVGEQGVAPMLDKSSKI